MGYPKDALSRDYLREIAEPVTGDFVRKAAAKSAENKVSVLLPIHEAGDGGSLFNTVVIIDRGKVLGGYRKIHMFDAFGFRESDLFQSGSEAVLFNISGFPLGVVTCYDLRFPELMKSEVMAGARAVIVPAAWFRGPMKEEQWQTLLMARAHENTSYVVGVGNANENFVGRSIVVDPFGVKVLDLGAGNRIGRYEIDDSQIIEARERIPVLKQSRNLQNIRCRQL
jgi:predicted amidohydrolase